jgi:hypothetical protein
MRGGKRDGAGRPTGAKNRRTVAVETAMQVVAERFKAEVPMAFDGDGVAYLQTVYRDPQQPTVLRIDAAVKAARYERPALAATLTKDLTPMAEAEASDSRPPIETFLIEFGQKLIDGEIAGADAAEGFAPSAAVQARVPDPSELPGRPDIRPRLPRAVAQDVEFSRAQDQARRPTADHADPTEAADKLVPFRGIGQWNLPENYVDD